jgi:hypothetical protein
MDSILSCKLTITPLFPGLPDLPIAIYQGIPQGSAISPLLFDIYVVHIYIAITNAFDISYVDNFSITVRSPSYQTNQSSLSTQAQYFAQTCQQLNAFFLEDKTKVICCAKSRQKSPPPTGLFLFTGILTAPCEKLILLGLWFDI